MTSFLSPDENVFAFIADAIDLGRQADALLAADRMPPVYRSAVRKAVEAGDKDKLRAIYDGLTNGCLPDELPQSLALPKSSKTHRKANQKSRTQATRKHKGSPKSRTQASTKHKGSQEATRVQATRNDAPTMTRIEVTLPPDLMSALAKQPGPRTSNVRRAVRALFAGSDPGAQAVATQDIEELRQTLTQIIAQLAVLPMSISALVKAS